RIDEARRQRHRLGNAAHRVSGRVTAATTRDRDQRRQAREPNLRPAPSASIGGAPAARTKRRQFTHIVGVRGMAWCVNPKIFERRGALLAPRRPSRSCVARGPSNDGLRVLFVTSAPFTMAL